MLLSKHIKHHIKIFKKWEKAMTYETKKKKIHGNIKCHTISLRDQRTLNLQRVATPNYYLTSFLTLKQMYLKDTTS